MLRRIIAISNHKIYGNLNQIRTFASEVDKAKKAEFNADEPTIFDKIISKEIKANIIYEDEKCLVFDDVNPQAPIHFLVIPKLRIPMIDHASKQHISLLGHLLLVGKELGQKQAPNGYRLVINNGPDGCQSVYHLHIHIIGGRQLNWPPG